MSYTRKLYCVTISSFISSRSYTLPAYTTKGAITRAIKDNWDMHGMDQLTGDEIDIKISAQCLGPASRVGRFIWECEKREGRPGFHRTPIDVAWRLQEEIPEGYLDVDYTSIYWMAREDMEKANPGLLREIETSILEEEALRL